MSLVQDDARCPLVKHLEQVEFSVVVLFVWVVVVFCFVFALDDTALLLRCQY